MNNYLLQRIRTEKDKNTVTPGGINGNGLLGNSPKKPVFIKHLNF